MGLSGQIEKIVESNGAYLYDIETIQDSGETIFRVYVTKAGGVNLELCAEISNEISPLLDVHPPLSGRYFLEVSSPGIERKLKKPNHFKSAVGERLKFKYDGERLKGILTKADDNGLFIKIGDRELFFDYSGVSKAKTYFEWNSRR
ncbi:MAG: ribosome maturation factor RimP [Epsilonproteobacteria bacterium]|nr:ribosome maturation factor RimP [Campylobacterota bacterium]